MRNIARRPVPWRLCAAGAGEIGEKPPMTDEADMAAVATAWLFDAPQVDDAWLDPMRHRLERSDDWLACCEQVVEARYRDQASARDGYARMGWALARLGRTSAALEYFARDLGAARMGRWQYFQYLQQSLAAGEIARATASAEDFTRQRPDVNDVWVRVAWHHHAAGDHAQAQAAYRRDHLRGRLSPKWILRLAEVDARMGDWDGAALLVDVAYQADLGLKDGLARLAMVCLEGNDQRGASAWLRREQQAGRISDDMVLVRAETEARLGHWAAAEALVLEVYGRNAALRDGFARLASVRASSSAWPQARDLLLRDSAAGRLSTAMTLRLAEAEARNGNWETAEPLVASVYAGEPAAVDGYARLGLARIGESNHADARKLLERDLESGRISSAMMLVLAETRAMTGDWAAAEELVGAVYRKDATARDGFGRLGRARLRVGAPAEAIGYFESDAAASRQSASFRIFHAQALAELLRFDEAGRAVAQAYDEAPAMRDGHVEVGRWIEKRFFQHGRRFFHRDRQLDRITPAALLHLAEMDARVGNEPDACQWIEQAYAADASLRDGHVRLARLKIPQGEWADAHVLAKRDDALGRLSDDARAEIMGWRKSG